MTDNKLYFEMACGDGTLKLSYEAAAALVRTAAGEISGVFEAMSSETQSPEWFGSKGIWIAPGEVSGSCRIRLYITVLLGEPISARAVAVQEKIKNALEASTFLTVEAVDVYVSGIRLEK